MIEPGVVTVTLTPELRQLALNHVRETVQGEDEEDLTRWFQEQETPDSYVLDAATDAAEAQMIAVIARAVQWQRESCPACTLHDGHELDCEYNDEPRV